ncbi:ABC transporter transmembrane region 2-domain-containing protein [Aspergillus undulatus]|uniref:ABC transporter transmembrane region 2-domain-containing protein n=1 Tax=Aspergillus undulatus TaxID=1810928 RepID=UPI003CCCF9F7
MAAQSTLQKRQDPLVTLYIYFASSFRDRVKRSSKATKVIATIALLLSIIGTGYGGYNWFRERAKERARGKRLLRRNSGIRGKDGSRTIYVPYKDSMTSKVKIYPTKPTTFDAHRRLFLNPPASARSGDEDPVGRIPPPTTKPGLNLAFLHQFLSLGSIMVPRWSSKETGLLMSHGVFLLLRTYLSLLIARLDGEIVRDLVAGKGRAFTWGILKWCGIGTLASYTNAMIKFLQSKVSIAFRTRLTRYIHDLYLTADNNYYKLMNLDGSIGQGPDQFITQDLTLFCSAAAALYSSMGKPLVDLFVFNYQLYRSLGPLALSGILTGYFSTAVVLRKLSPPFGKLKAVEGKKEGDFRGLHSRLLANAEEISFYGGADTERVFLTRSFKDLQRWMEGIYSLKIRYNMLEDVILKYSWSAFGYLVTSLPVFLPAWGGSGGALELAEKSEASGRERGRMKEFITNKRLMLSLADAGGRMMYSIKDISELAGYTSRVYSLVSTLHRVHANAYYPPRDAQSELFSLEDVQGTIHNGFDGVRLEQVPVVAPSLYPMGGDELLESLSFVVHSGDHLLISGPNGVGKSAIARIVAGLWPVYRGLVSRPRGFGLDGAMFLPQRPYLSVGTLRDQVIYPHTEIDMRDAGFSDSALQKILDDAHLGYLPSREGGWDSRKEWKDVLSGGEKQRMAMARIFYHEPRYAFLDEGTSAVSSDVEGLLYEQAKDRGITVITISTRASLKKYHTFNLTIGVGADGEQWQFERIGTAKEKLGVEKEIQEIRKRLDKVDEWKKRREQIEDELRKVWVNNGELAPPPYEESITTAEGENRKIMFSFPLEPQVRGPVEPEPETNIQQNPQNPQIETTQQESEDDSEGVVVIPIDRSFSDGDPSTWPTEERFGRPDDTNYRQKLAELWLRKTGAYEPGVTYIIDELPGGYVLFDRPRGSNPAIVRRGRPSGLRRPGRPPGKLGTIICDNEGTPDVFKFAVTKLKQLGELDNDISEPQSMDWRAERAGMEEYLETLDMRPSYLPRLGELVLWAPNFKGELLWNQKTQSVQIYSPKGKWLEKPRWRAGVVGQIPTEETVLQDLVESTGKKWGLNYSGFRVETLPDPNGSDKSYSLHYGYVPLKCIKPFNAFEYFLQGTPREQLHPSIEHAMTVMSSFNLVDKHRFKGVWPNASIYSRGIFIGAEFLTVGDAIRLKPKGHNAEAIAQNPPIVDVMLINDIRLDLTECDADLKSKHLAEKYDVRISGRVFTTNVERAQTDNNGQPVRPLSLHDVLDVFNTGGMSGYGEWYEIHPGSTVDISQDMVLGRCYEPDAMKLLFNTRSLAYDINGILSARKYSRQVDERIPEGKRWFWGDFRTQTLGIDSLNGEDVGHYSETRDVKMWRANLRIVDGTASQADLKAAKHPAERGRPSIKPQLAEVSKMSKLVSAGLGAVDTSNPVSETDEESSDEVEETNGGNNGKEEKELRGGTEETEGGDYVPDNEDEPNSKRSKHSFQVDFGTAGQ